MYFISKINRTVSIDRYYNIKLLLLSSECTQYRSHSIFIKNRCFLRKQTDIKFISKRFASGERQVGKLFEFLSDSIPVRFTQELLLKFHDYTGLPWWGTIILSTFLIRSTIVPLAIHQNYVVASSEQVNIDLSKVEKEVFSRLQTEAVQKGWDEKKIEYEYKKLLKVAKRRLNEEHNSHPAKLFLMSAIQFPIWVCFSTALRNLVYKLPDGGEIAEITYLQMSLSSFLWLPNLVVPDSSCMLPILIATINLTLIEIQKVTKFKQNSPTHSMMYGMFRLFTIFIVYFASHVPSVVSLYWFTSSLYGLIQYTVLLSPRIRKFFGIPVSSNFRKHPYNHIARRLTANLRFLRY